MKRTLFVFQRDFFGRKKNFKMVKIKLSFMVQKINDNDAHLECEEKFAREYKNTLSKEVRDYIRTGDSVILKRVLFKLFINQTVPERFKQDKAHAVMMMMIDDSNVSSTVQFDE